MEGDPTCLYQIAQAIVEIQNLYGPIPRVWGKGVTAKQVWELVQRLNRENGEIKHADRPCIDQILILDRYIKPIKNKVNYYMIFVDL